MRSNVKQHMVVGAGLGIAAGLALASVELQRCNAHSPQSDRSPCGIAFVVVGVPAVTLGSLVGGFFGWVSADRPHHAERR